MKRIIYAAAFLIICASAFGINDFIKADNTGTLVNYQEEETTAESAVKVSQTVIPETEATENYFIKNELDTSPIVFSPELSVKVKNKIPKKIVRESFAVNADEKKVEEVSSESGTNSRRRINMGMFSRGTPRRMPQDSDSADVSGN